MPGYAAGKAFLLQYNKQHRLWSAETVAAGSASQAVQLRRIEGRSYPWGCAIEVQFSAIPGAFACDVQAAEVDRDASYVKVGGIIAVNAGFTGRIDLTSATPFYGKFLRLFMTTLTNAVTTTAVVTR